MEILLRLFHDLLKFIMRRSPLNNDFNPDRYISAKVTREEVMEIKSAFDAFDIDSNGYLDRVRIAESIENLGMTGGKWGKLGNQIKNYFLYPIADLEDYNIYFDDFFLDFAELYAS